MGKLWWRRKFSRCRLKIWLLTSLKQMAARCWVRKVAKKKQNAIHTCWLEEERPVNPIHTHAHTRRRSVGGLLRHRRYKVVVADPRNTRVCVLPCWLFKKNMGLCVPEGPRLTPSAAMKYCSTNGRVVLLLLRSIKTTKKRREEKRKKARPVDRSRPPQPLRANRSKVLNFRGKKIGSSFWNCARTLRTAVDYFAHGGHVARWHKTSLSRTSLCFPPTDCYL